MQFKELHDTLVNYYDAKHQLSMVVCPFITVQTIQDILSTRTNRQCVIITSWRSDHLLTGVSSLDLYDVCQNNGWTLFVNDRLHMKLYSRDLDSAWVGSANLTNRALSDDERSNHEVLTFNEELTTDDKIMIQRVQAESVLVTEEVHRQYKQWLDAQQSVELPPPDPVEIDTTESAFHTSQLPHSDTPERLWEVANDATDLRDYEQAAMEHDLAVYPVDTTLSLDEFMVEMKAVFFAHPFIETFAREITPDGIHFGGVKQWIKQNCTDVPVPHARELTFPTQALVEWFPSLDGNQYQVDRPRHSQILRRINNQ